MMTSVLQDGQVNVGLRVDCVEDNLQAMLSDIMEEVPPPMDFSNQEEVIDITTPPTNDLGETNNDFFMDVINNVIM